MHGMIKRIIYTPEAEGDVADSYDWYESREPGLGEDFLRSVEACLATIQRHPHIFPVAVETFDMHQSAVSHSKYFMNLAMTKWWSMQSFIARETQLSGATGCKPAKDQQNWSGPKGQHD